MSYGHGSNSNSNSSSSAVINLLQKSDSWTEEHLIDLLSLPDDSEQVQILFRKAYETKCHYVGNKVYLRGLVEFSNVCQKNCYYCGLRQERQLDRYLMSSDEIIACCMEAYKEQYGSVVLQAGERRDSHFVKTINDVLKKLPPELAVTLSVGEFSEEIYKEFKDNGAKRFLLRIETSNPTLYSKLHPDDNLHSFHERLNCLNSLIKLGYQTGTGVMIGVPFQTLSDLAHDLLFFREVGVHMVGMGPYLEHEETPLYQHKDELLSKTERLHLSLKMIAILRCMMKDINIASATSLETIHEKGRLKGLLAGANVVMPNLTPHHYRQNYELYQNKPRTDSSALILKNGLQKRLQEIGEEIALGVAGDPKCKDKHK